MSASVVVAVGAVVAAISEIGAQPTSRSEGATVVAQRQSQQRPAPAAPAPAPAAPAAPQQPAVPQHSESTVMDSWVVNCVQLKAGDAKKTCSAMLQVTQAEKRQVLFAWIIGRNAQGALTSVFQTPTGVQIQPGVEIKLGESTARKVGYRICVQNGCEAELAMDSAMIRDATAAANGNTTATVTIADGRRINFTFPIKGIDKALAAIGR